MNLFVGCFFKKNFCPLYHWHITRKVTQNNRFTISQDNTKLFYKKEQFSYASVLGWGQECQAWIEHRTNTKHRNKRIIFWYHQKKGNLLSWEDIHRKTNNYDVTVNKEKRNVTATVWSMNPGISKLTDIQEPEFYLWEIVGLITFRKQTV